MTQRVKQQSGHKGTSKMHHICLGMGTDKIIVIPMPLLILLLNLILDLKPPAEVSSRLFRSVVVTPSTTVSDRHGSITGYANEQKEKVFFLILIKVHNLNIEHLSTHDI